MFEVSPSICILVAGGCTSSGGPVNKDRYSEGKKCRKRCHALPMSWLLAEQNKKPFKACNYKDANNYKKLSKEQSMLK